MYTEQIALPIYPIGARTPSLPVLALAIESQADRLNAVSANSLRRITEALGDGRRRVGGLRGKINKYRLGTRDAGRSTEGLVK